MQIRGRNEKLLFFIIDSKSLNLHPLYAFEFGFFHIAYSFLLHDDDDYIHFSTKVLFFFYTEYVCMCDDYPGREESL